MMKGSSCDSKRSSSDLLLGKRGQRVSESASSISRRSYGQREAGRKGIRGVTGSNNHSNLELRIVLLYYCLLLPRIASMHKQERQDKMKKKLSGSCRRHACAGMF